MAHPQALADGLRGLGWACVSSILVVLFTALPIAASLLCMLTGLLHLLSGLYLLKAAGLKHVMLLRPLLRRLVLLAVLELSLPLTAAFARAPAPATVYLCVTLVGLGSLLSVAVGMRIARLLAYVRISAQLATSRAFIASVLVFVLAFALIIIAMATATRQNFEGLYIFSLVLYAVLGLIALGHLTTALRDLSNVVCEAL